MMCGAGQPAFMVGFVPNAVNDESQDRPVARTDQDGKAALRIAILFALTWPASVQREEPVAAASGCHTTARSAGSRLGAWAMLGIAFVRRSSRQGEP